MVAPEAGVDWCVHIWLVSRSGATDKKTELIVEEDRGREK